MADGSEMLAYLLFFEEDNNEDKPCLSLEDRRRRSKKIPRIALTQYQQSAFRVMFDSGNNQALINCCAVDHRVFRQLLELFKPVFDSHAIDHATGLIKKLKHTVNGH